MTDYSELVKSLRCELHGVPCHDENCEWLWHGGGCCDEVRLMCAAAVAIEELQAEQKKTVTQIFGEEQIAWEGRCKDLLYQIADLQAEVPKRGKWVRVEDGESYHYECSECGERPLYSRYGDVVLSGVCPLCGAKMEVQDGQ